MSKVTDVDYLKFLCQKLAYVCFVRDERLRENGIKHENIKSFEVKIFIDGLIDDEGEVDHEVAMRFTVNTNVHEVPEVCFLWKHPVLMNAMAQKAVVLEDTSQHYTFKYETAPNPIELFDAEYLLEQELGVLVE